MARRKVKFSPGCYYHVYNRGANRELIFYSPENYLFLLDRIRRQMANCCVSVIAYCLMPNHYHFLLRQDREISISAFVQAIFNSYSKAINKRYRRSGTLFESPFKAIPVDDEVYLTHLCRYIHRNPLEAKLVRQLHRWPYSNYPEWIEKRNGKIIDRVFVKSFFPAPEDYERFVLDYKPPKSIEDGLGKYL